jgi:hypothetical protein
MYKKFLFVLLVFSASTPLHAQSGRIDSVAVSILDHMSAVIGDLGSCSITVKSNYDVQSVHLGLVKHSNEEQVYMQGPNKMLIRSEGDKGSRSFVYNGNTLSYYSYDKNQFAEVEAAGTLMEMIDTVNKLYGVDFPVADFFYPSFVDDIISDAINLVYLGTTNVDGKECFHIAGTAKDKTFQFWISNDPFYLPIKMVIVYTAKEMNPQYEAVLSNWQINPSLPGSLFDFTPPPKAKKIRLSPLSKPAPSSKKK